MDESRNIWLHMENSFDGSFMQKVNSWKLNFVVDTRELWLWMEAFFMTENSQWNVLEIWWRSIDKWAKNYGRIVDEIMTPEWLNILLNICAFDEGLQLLKIDEEVRENTDTGGRDFLAERTREEFYFREDTHKSFLGSSRGLQTLIELPFWYIKRVFFLRNTG